MQKGKIYLFGAIAVVVVVAVLFVSKNSKNELSENSANAKEAVKEVVKEDVTDYDSWKLGCGKANKNGQKPCRVFQQVKDGKSEGVTVVFLAGKDKDKIVSSMRVIAPLGVNLRARLGFSVDDKKPSAIPFNACGPRGCFVNVGIKDDFIEKIKSGTAMHIMYQGMQAGAKPIKLDVPLKGFYKAYEAMLKNISK